MRLILDHTQRLNLHALLGAQLGDVATVRAVGAIQDKLALDADEEQALSLVRETANGQERTVWNSSLSIPAKEIEFTDSEISRIRGAIKTWAQYGTASDRRWLEPLVDLLVKPEPLRETLLRSSGAVCLSYVAAALVAAVLNNRVVHAEPTACRYDTSVFLPLPGHAVPTTRTTSEASKGLANRS